MFADVFAGLCVCVIVCDVFDGLFVCDGLLVCLCARGFDCVCVCCVCVYVL